MGYEVVKRQDIFVSKSHLDGTRPLKLKAYVSAQLIEIIALSQFFKVTVRTLTSLNNCSLRCSKQITLITAILACLQQKVRYSISHCTNAIQIYIGSLCYSKARIFVIQLRHFFNSKCKTLTHSVVICFKMSLVASRK